MTRHRFVGTDPATLCAEERCGESYYGPKHYADDDHPYTPDEEYPGECGWRLQGQLHLPQKDDRCAGDPSDPIHAPALVPWSADEAENRWHAPPNLWTAVGSHGEFFVAHTEPLGATVMIKDGVPVGMNGAGEEVPLVVRGAEEPVFPPVSFSEVFGESPVVLGVRTDPVFTVDWRGDPPPEWRASKAIRPPDEDSEAREVSGDASLNAGSGTGFDVSPLRARTSAHGSTSADRRAGSARVARDRMARAHGASERADAAVRSRSDVQTAVEAVLGPHGQIVEGPWPVRKYVLRSATDWMTVVGPLLDGLIDVGVTFSIESWYPERTSADRCVLVTWGPWYGYGLEALADELTVSYGE